MYKAIIALLGGFLFAPMVQAAGISSLLGCWNALETSITRVNGVTQTGARACLKLILPDKQIMKCQTNNPKVPIYVSSYPYQVREVAQNNFSVTASIPTMKDRQQYVLTGNHLSSTLHKDLNTLGGQQADKPMRIHEVWEKVGRTTCNGIEDSSIAVVQHLNQPSQSTRAAPQQGAGASNVASVGAATTAVKGAPSQSGYRIVKTQHCADGVSSTGLIIAEASPGFSFGDNTTVRSALDSLLNQAPKNSICGSVASLLIANGARSDCDGYGMHPLLVGDGTKNCISPPGSAYAYRISTPPGKVMNLSQGQEFYWNSIISPREKAQKEAAEARENEQRIARNNAAAAKENEARNAKNRAMEDLRATVVSTWTKPSEADMKRRIEQEIIINSKGFIRLLGFSKRDGLDREFGGVKTYQMEWRAMIEIVNDCFWNNTTFEAIPPPQGMDGILYATSGYRQGKKGQRIDLDGQTTFTKTEKGWRQ